MERRQLGRDGPRVSAICLGTMTWGRQNTEAEGHAQLDMALDRGVDFIDTAELYAVPPEPATQGRTEEIIGTWLAARKCRDRVVLATKVIGRAPHLSHIRDGRARLDRANITAALEASLRRLNTDVIDLYQLHWPDRSANYFGRLGFVPDPDEDPTPLEETLGVLDDLARAGKIRRVGVSNETPWGLMRYLALAEAGRGPRMAAIQNPYSLLNRTFEVGLAEVAIREQCGLLAYSPLGFGTLTGKYLNGARPPGCRLTLFPEYRRYLGDQAQAATAAYVDIARRHGLDPAAMAVAFVLGRPFVTSAIIGATTLDQLSVLLDAADLALSDDVLAEIEAVHARHPNPAP